MNIRLARRLSSLYVFYLIATKGSQKAAANELDISAASVHERLHGLDEVAGVKLLGTGPRRTWVTPAGEEIFGRIKGPIAELENILLEMSQGVFNESSSSTKGIRPNPASAGTFAGIASPGEAERSSDMLPRSGRPSDDDRSQT